MCVCVHARACVCVCVCACARACVFISLFLSTIVDNNTVSSKVNLCYVHSSSLHMSNYGQEFTSTGPAGYFAELVFTIESKRID